MAIPVKSILAGTAVVGVGGTGVWMLSTLGMPNWRSLSKDSDISSYDSKYAKKYSRYLVGVDSTKDKDNVSVSNVFWWDWAFKNRYQNKTDTKIKQIV